jgi:hypothetical protein
VLDRACVAFVSSGI